MGLITNILKIGIPVVAGFLLLRNAGGIGNIVGGAVGSGLSNFGTNLRDSFLAGLNPLAVDTANFFEDAAQSFSEGTQAIQNAAEGAGIIPAFAAEDKASQAQARPSIPKFNISLSRNALTKITGRVASSTPFRVERRFPSGNLPRFVSEVQFRQMRVGNERVSAENIRGQTIRVSPSSRARLAARGYIIG